MAFERVNEVNAVFFQEPYSIYQHLFAEQVITNWSLPLRGEIQHSRLQKKLKVPFGGHPASVNISV